MTRYLQHNTGFTLLEVLLATLILGVCAELVAMNMLGSMPQRRLSGATRQLTWDLMRARKQAIKLQHTVQVTVVDAQTYAIWTDTNHNGVTESGEVAVKTLQDKYQGVALTATNPVTFNARGGSTTVTTITLTNTHGAKVINVNIAGFVKANA